MDKVLSGLKATARYFDDITITGASDEGYLQNLANVSEHLQQHGFCLKKEK